MNVTMIKEEEISQCIILYVNLNRSVPGSRFKVQGFQPMDRARQKGQDPKYPNYPLVWNGFIDTMKTKFHWYELLVGFQPETLNPEPPNLFPDKPIQISHTIGFKGLQPVIL